MELAKLVTRPTLVEVKIDKEELCKKHAKGEPIVFWTWDRMKLTDFMSMASSEESMEQQMQTRMMQMVLDKDGKPIFDEDASLPMDLLAALMNKLMETMGK